jgi:hypothetical protein
MPDPIETVTRNKSKKKYRRKKLETTKQADPGNNKGKKTRKNPAEQKQLYRRRQSRGSDLHS